jgi:hypothetical protein
MTRANDIVLSDKGRNVEYNSVTFKNGKECITVLHRLTGPLIMCNVANGTFSLVGYAFALMVKSSPPHSVIATLETEKPVNYDTDSYDEVSCEEDEMYTDELDEYIQVVKSELGYEVDQKIDDKSVVKMIKEDAWKRMCESEGTGSREDFKKLPKRKVRVHSELGPRIELTFVCNAVHEADKELLERALGQSHGDEDDDEMPLQGMYVCI